MKHKLIYCCMLIFLSCVNNNDNNLLNEYKLLYTDLSNIRTWGYKSFFDIEINQAGKNINISQGALIHTGVETHFAIAREGFLKIRLENGLPGYTRYGDFRVDSDGNFVASNGYFLYDNIFLAEYFLPETIRITKDHIVYFRVPEKNGNLTEIKAGQILTYIIPNELLSHYKDAIYVIKDGVDYNELLSDYKATIYVIKDGVEFTEDTALGITFYQGSFHQGFLESSNVFLLPTVLRMYYILSVINKDLIPNIEFKKELLKIQMEKMADSGYELNKTTLDSRLYYLESILPFIKYDY